MTVKQRLRDFAQDWRTAKESVSKMPYQDRTEAGLRVRMMQVAERAAQRKSRQTTQEKR